jgi:hypothetical protein
MSSKKTYVEQGLTADIVVFYQKLRCFGPDLPC